MKEETVDEVCTRLAKDEEKPTDWTKAIKFYEDIANNPERNTLNKDDREKRNDN